jgi:hypothetical protein
MRCGDGSSTPTRAGPGVATLRTEQAQCLTLVTNALVLFNTIYLQDSLAALRCDGFSHLGDDHVARLSPALLDHVNVCGSLTFDVEHELGRAGHRPLRQPHAIRS